MAEFLQIGLHHSKIYNCPLRYRLGSVLKLRNYEFPKRRLSSITRPESNNNLSLHSNGKSVQCFHITNNKRNLSTHNSLVNHSSNLLTREQPFQIKNSVSLKQEASKMSTGRNEATLREKYKPRDREFKTPYGHIACLEWGNQTAPYKILCVHGWLDNAGSFERLIPFILDHNDNFNKYHIIAMDQPGVGLSSHKPSGAEYSEFTTVIEMRRIIMNLQWDKVTLLSHSLGAHLSFLYSAIYPSQVESFVSIDLLYPITRSLHNWNLSVASSIEDHFKCEYNHKDDPVTSIRVPVYSEEDALRRLMDGHSNSLTRESAGVMLKRGATKQRWGYTLNRDIRLRYLIAGLPFDDNLMFQCMSTTFKPNLFIIRAKHSPYRRSEERRLKYYELYKKNCRIFLETTLDGTHHIHLNSPELVAPEINKFLDDVRESQQGTVAMDKSNL